MLNRWLGWLKILKYLRKSILIFCSLIHFIWYIIKGYWLSIQKSQNLIFIWWKIGLWKTNSCFSFFIMSLLKRLLHHTQWQSQRFWLGGEGVPTCCGRWCADCGSWEPWLVWPVVSLLWPLVRRFWLCSGGGCSMERLRVVEEAKWCAGGAPEVVRRRCAWS